MKIALLELFGENIYSDVAATLYRGHFLDTLRLNSDGIDLDKDVKRIAASTAQDLVKQNYEKNSLAIAADLANSDAIFIYLTSVTMGVYNLVNKLKSIHGDKVRLFTVNESLKVVPAIIVNKTHSFDISKITGELYTFALTKEIDWIYSQRTNVFGEVELFYYEHIEIIHTEPLEKHISLYHYLDARYTTSLNDMQETLTQTAKQGKLRLVN